jgi:O-antigen/teichoic acid export membrane protein
VALSMLLFGVYGVIAQIIALKKKTHIGGAIWIIAALLNFGLNFIFVPRFGILGAGITTLLAYAFAFITAGYYSFKKLRFEIDWKTILKSIFASVLMSLFVIWLKPIGFYKVVTTIILSVLVYGILISLLKCFSKKEVDFLKGFLNLKGR